MKKGDILFNEKYFGFHQVKEIIGDFVVISGCSNFLQDAKTNIMRKLVLKSDLETKDFSKVNDTFLFNHRDIVKVDLGIRVNAQIEKSYLFYKDSIIKHSWYEKLHETPKAISIIVFFNNSFHEL